MFRSTFRPAVGSGQRDNRSHTCRIVIEQALESASIGAFGTVAALWSGLELAEEYVGAVSTPTQMA